MARLHWHLAMELRQPHNDHRVLLLLDPEGNIAGAVAHEQSELRVRGIDVDARKLFVAGLRVDLQGSWWADHRLSSHLLGAAIHDLSDKPPELLVARVATCNIASRKLLDRHRIGLELSQVEPGYVDLVGVYDEVVETL